MAAIEQRGEATRVNWRLGGSRQGARQSCTFRGTPEARGKLAQLAKSIIEARNHNVTRDEAYTLVLGKPDTDASVPTFKQWVDLWIADRARMRDIQSDVVTYYHRMLTSRVVPFLGHLRLTDIDQDILRDWVAWMSSSRITIGSKNRRAGDRLLSPATIRRAHAITHACLSAAVPKWIPVNPAARPPGSSKHTSGLPKKVAFEGMFLTRDEVNLILDHCDPVIRDLVYIAVRTGMRMGELLALEARSVVFDRQGSATIKVQRALKNDGTVGPPKSNTSHRDIPVGKKASQILAARVKGRKPSALVFPSPKGGMWDEGNLRHRYWYASVAAAQRCPEHPPPDPPKPARGPARALRHDEVSTCDCPTRLHRRPRFHDLRHTHASVLIAERWHAKKIQLRLGHATYQTTMNVYSHLFDLGNSGELDGIDEALDAPALAVLEPSSRRSRRVGSAARRAPVVAVRRRLVRR